MPLFQSLARGFRCRCPSCGEGQAFRAFLKVRDNCEVCGEDFSHHRADDAPPYFTIMIVGHIIVPLMVFYDRLAAPPLWHQMLIATVGTLALCLWFLPRIISAAACSRM